MAKRDQVLPIDNKLRKAVADRVKAVRDMYQDILRNGAGIENPDCTQTTVETFIKDRVDDAFSLFAAIQIAKSLGIAETWIGMAQGPGAPEDEED